jgi:hypothetical protein
LNYWLQNERFDLPLEITRISHASYNVPITAEGTLPVRLFGRELNLKRLQEKTIPWLICYGTHDDLVEKETALAPLDHVDAEVTPFPKGHVAIATSWSAPDSACGLHTRFGDGDYRGPVRFHMDLEAALTEARAPATKARSGKTGAKKSPAASNKKPPKTAPANPAKAVKKAVPKQKKAARSAKASTPKKAPAKKGKGAASRSKPTTDSQEKKP